MANAGPRMGELAAIVGRTAVVAEPPLAAYRTALARYAVARLRAIQAALGFSETGQRSAASLAGQIAEHLESPRAIEPVLAGLDHGARLALGLFALTETASWPLVGLSQTLECLGVEPRATVRVLVDLGLLAVSGEPATDRDPSLAIDPVSRLEGDREREPDGQGQAPTLHAHPVVLASSRTVLPVGSRPEVAGSVRHVREADGLEPVLRLAALWQRVEEAPLRQTQQGLLYKRDRERLEDDPVLAGPIADALEPLPDMAALWLTLAREVGLIVPDPGGDRAVAAPPDFWAEHAFHLPQMIASRWLGLRHWHEQGGMRQEGSTVELALPYLRPAVLLWLATIGPDDWVAVDDLGAHLQRLAPRWDRATLLDEPPTSAGSGNAAAAATASRSRSVRGGKPEGAVTPPGLGPGVLDALLLGAAYQLGLVRGAEEVAGGRRVVQLSPLGRYVLALGAPPSPRPSFEHFLFIQPNFEIIAYRQGLTPLLIGTFSRFAQWSQIGAAIELKLTAESVYRGLEGGLSERAMLERLERHSPRALPASVAEALRTWASRRERVTYYASATLIEFASRADLEQGLKLWPADARAPLRISDRLLLVEDESAIPFQRFRLAGSRDYRRAPESCLEVEPDGVSLTLDLARSDLLVDAELARFTEEQPSESSLLPSSSPGPPRNPRRRFLVTPASLQRASENGLTPALLAHWYVKRTGSEMPPAVHLLFQATTTRTAPLETSRPLILRAPSAQWLDGLFQHPATRGYLGERLGPTAVIIPDELLNPFRRALEGIGLTLAVEPRGDRD